MQRNFASAKVLTGRAANLEAPTRNLLIGSKQCGTAASIDLRAHAADTLDACSGEAGGPIAHPRL
jgi:hypothetical protein